MFRILLALLLVGCGTIEQPKTIEVQVDKPVPVPFYIDTAKVDSKLLPYVMEFAGYCEKFKTSEICQKNFKKIKSIETVKSFSDKTVLGKCYMYSNGQRWIEISSHWADLDSQSMRAVVIHEMAHCTLGVGNAEVFPHYDDDEDIMNAYLLSDKTLFYNWPKLIKAMFQRAGGTLSLTYQEEVATVTQTVMDSSGGLSCETRKD